MPPGDTVTNANVRAAVNLPNVGGADEGDPPNKSSFGQISRRQLDNLPASITRFFAADLGSTRTARSDPRSITPAANDSEQEARANTKLTSLLEKHTDFISQVEQEIESKVVDKNNAAMMTKAIDTYINTLVDTLSSTHSPERFEETKEVTDKLIDLKHAIRDDLMSNKDIKAIDTSRQLIREIKNALITNIDDQTALDFINKIERSIDALVDNIDADNATEVLRLNNQLFELKEQIKEGYDPIETARQQGRTIQQERQQVDLEAEVRERKIEYGRYVPEQRRNHMYEQDLTTGAFTKMDPDNH